ncbi:ROK family protein [Phaeacidiphilus oryzae]|uniref:ROK family protein n=1 Tax=Phaeacidiphilus oryzae TaxID=348818 RepID=UPI00055E2007|nr:ROK family protein [Phaeacidiphilus oryzae]
MTGQHVLAIDLGGTKTALATAAPDGTVLHEESIPTRAAAGADQIIRRMAECGRELTRRTAAEGHGPLAAVAAVSPGIVQDDRILFAPNNPGWDRLALPELLRRTFGVQRVAADNDVRAAALAEARWGALAGVPYGIYLNLGTGIAAAPVIDGRVVRGAHGAGGELGYQLLGADRLVGAAAGRAPLEEYVSGIGLEARGSELLGRTVSTAEVFALAAEGRQRQPAVAEFLDEALDTLGVHLANLACVFDPEVVAVGGGMAAKSGGYILPRLARVLDAAVPFPPKLVPAAFDARASLAGATALALDAAASA